MGGVGAGEGMGWRVWGCGGGWVGGAVLVKQLTVGRSNDHQFVSRISRVGRQAFRDVDDAAVLVVQLQDIARPSLRCCPERL